MSDTVEKVWLKPTVREFLEWTRFNISEGAEYCWTCFPDARIVECSEDGSNPTAAAVYNRKTGLIYMVEVWYAIMRHPPVRWINPNFIAAYRDEGLLRDIDVDFAYDEEKFQDMEFLPLMDLVKTMFSES